MNANNNFLRQHKKNNSCRTFIIAEAGVHHGCNLATAMKLIEAAAEAGADAIKFQTYKSATLVTRWAPKYWEHSEDKDGGTQFDYFQKRDKFRFKDYQALATHAERNNIIFCSTPFDYQSVRWLNDLGIPFWKVASADIDNYPLLDQIADTQKPIILSTGASYFNEIRETVNFLKSRGINDLALLHCSLAYPTPDHDANLLRITELKKLFPKIPIGYSDHTMPDSEVTIPVLAVAVGAQIIEKHFTLDRTIPEDDHYHSVDPILLSRMTQRIKLAEAATMATAEVTDSEMPARKNARRSLVADQVILKGTAITKEMVVPKRPGGGISPAKATEILGRKVNTTIQEDELISWDQLA